MINKLATCWRIFLNEGRLLLFTDSDQDIVLDGELYKSGAYFIPSSIISSNELGQDNFTISGIIDGKFITEEGLLAGDLSNSYIEVFLINLANRFEEKIILKTGWLGEIKYSQQNFTAEVHSLSAKTNNIIGKCYSSSCRAELGDKFCKVNLKNYSFYGEITMILEDNSFIDSSRIEPDDYFYQGILIFISGNNRNHKYSVKCYKESKITIDILFDLKLEMGDKYMITIGCDKQIDSCINKFNNALNFRGEPYVPNKHMLIA